jgi:Putative transposase
VLAYLARYTHRVAISNAPLIRLDDNGVTFRWKDYRARGNAPGNAWIKPMTLAVDEFIRRFLLHVPPSGHRIRHYGLFASPKRAANMERLRDLIAAANAGAQPFHRSDPPDGGADANHADAPALSTICPCCGGRMSVVETFARGAQPRSFKADAARIDTS